MFQRKRFRLRLPSRTLLLGERTLVMGVLNITPDSFSDGGRYLDSEAAIAHGLQLERDGADILDVGGESTRPGATPTTPEDELRHDVTDEIAAYRLANVPFPGLFGVFFENDRPTKNALERKSVENTRNKLGNPTDIQLLQATFDRMK